MKTAIGVLTALITTIGPAVCQADTSSYPRPYQQPSMLDTIGQVQRLEIQRQQIEMQRLQLQQRELQMRQAEELQRRQLDFERRQAEIDRRRQLTRGKAKKVTPQNSN